MKPTSQQKYKLNVIMENIKSVSPLVHEKIIQAYGHKIKYTEESGHVPTLDATETEEFVSFISYINLGFIHQIECQ